MARRTFVLCLVLSLLVNAFSLPSDRYRSRWRRQSDQGDTNDIQTSTTQASTTSSTTSIVIGDDKSSSDDDDDDDFDQPSTTTSNGGSGSGISSLLSLVSALFPSSSSSGGTSINHKLIQAQMAKVIREIIRRNQMPNARVDIKKNIIEIDINRTADFKPFGRQESEEDNHSDTSESESKEESGAEESIEDGGNNSKQDSASNASNGSDDSDYDEPPGGDGQGGILGLLAGLSGDGDLDLGSLLAAAGGIVANLSGDGVDINGVIATALGLIVGLLSDGTQNPGEIIAEYIVTALDTISGGGAKNNGAFFGNFVSKIVKGISAAGDSDESSNDMKTTDSAGFVISLIMGLLGEMSKTSSAGSWR